MFDGVLARGRVAGGGLRRGVAAGDARRGGGAGAGARAAGRASRTRSPPRARLDLTRELGERAAASGNPVVPLVEALRERGAAPEVAPRRDEPGHPRHRADARRPRRARGRCARTSRAAAGAAARLAREHRATPIAGRTLLQQAVPTTFGLKAAGWMAGSTRRARGSPRSGPRRSSAGPAGTLDGLGPEVLARYAAELGLDEPVLPWHTERTRIARSRRRARHRRGRDRQGRPATSCCSPRPRSARCARPRPAARRRCRTSATRSRRSPRGPAPGRRPGWSPRCSPRWSRSTSAPPARGTRSGSPLRSLLVSTGSAAAWLRTCLEGLEVDAERMRANLGEHDGGAVASAAALVDRALGARQPLSPRRRARPSARRRRASRRPRARRSAP